jgi:hypothetical protein
MTEIDRLITIMPMRSRVLLRDLRQRTELQQWDARSTVWANGWGLLRLRKNKLTLTAKGWKVAAKL